MIFIRAISIKEFAIRMKNAGSNSIEIGKFEFFPARSHNSNFRWQAKRRASYKKILIAPR